MTKERWIIIGIAAAVGGAAAIYHATRPAERISLDLIQHLDAAEQRPADPSPREWCVPKEMSLGGESKLAIAVLPSARVIWKAKVPPGASFRAWVGLEPDAWTGEGDGVLFRVGVSDGTSFRDLFIRQVDPFHVPGDRRWVPVTVDLSAYAGLDVSVILNTNASPPDKGNDTRHDKPVWGAPAIVTRR
jgi:hypothetical protein